MATPAIDKWLRMTYFKAEDLTNAHMDFRQLVEQERIDLCRARKIFLNSHPKMGSLIPDHIHKSSGTTGEPKIYPCGPSTLETISYWRRLTLHGCNYSRVINLNCFGDNDLDKRATGGKNIVVQYPQGRDFDTLVSFYGPHMNEDMFWRDMTEDYRVPVVVQVSPHALLKLLHYGFTFSKVPPELVTMYSTGESPDAQNMEYLKTLGLSIREGMRVYDGGASFFTCEHGSKHWDNVLCDITIGQNNELISDDLTNMSSNALGYWNGDRVSVSDMGTCQCGLVRREITFMDRIARSFNIGGLERDYDDMSMLFKFAVKDAMGIDRLPGQLNLCIGFNEQCLIFVYMAGDLDIDSHSAIAMETAIRKYSMVPDTTTIRFIRGWKDNGFKPLRMFVPSEEETEHFCSGGSF